MIFAVLDDTAVFLKALQAEWEGVQDDYPAMTGQFVRITGRTAFAGQISTLADCNHLLLDASLLTTERMQDLLLTAPQATLWMMTGKGQPDESDKWQSWVKQHPDRVKAQWFEKPLNLARSVLPVWLATEPASCQMQEGVMQPAKDELGSFPFPCRWFNADGVPVLINALWCTAIDAFPNAIGPEDAAGLNQGSVLTLDTWCEWPTQPGQFGKVRFACSGWRGGFLQMGLSLPDERGDSVDQAISDIFQLMLAGGNFTRARYYQVLRVPGCAGILQLERASYELDVRLPVFQPLGTTMSQRINDYDAAFASVKDKKKEKLINFPRENANDLCSAEDDIQYWCKHAQTAKTPWLTLPICMHGKKQTSSILVFDRLGGSQNQASDVSGEAIPDELVKRLEPKLLGAIHHMRQAMARDAQAARLEQREGIGKWRERFAQEVDEDSKVRGDGQLTQLEASILRAAKELTGAESALLALRPPAAHYLESRTHPDELMGGLRLKFERRRFVAVQCLLKKEAIYLPDYHGLVSREDAITDEDWADALEHVPADGRAARVPKLKEWQANSLGSLIALPVKYDDSLLGVLVLRHREKFFFTEQRVKLAERLIQEAHPFLRRARARTARDAWDSMIFHDVRSGLGHIRNQADWVLNPSPSRTPRDAAQAIMARTELMTDLSNEVLALLGYPDERTDIREYNRHDPLSLLQGLWSALESLPEANGKSFDASAINPQRPLHDARNALPHVLRVLLENALRYGGTGVIRVKSINDDEHWKVQLCNPGAFSNDVLHNVFTTLTSREDLAQDSMRVHIGLATCRRVLDAIDGKIVLENLLLNDVPHASVTLYWPYDKHWQAHIVA